MKRNKKEILMSVLALNIAGGAYLNATPSVSGERIYGRMIKNLETGKSNKDNYKLLESVLKQKNKELKDLYIQGDYIIKPEFLEWQIFFSGFNERIKRGDNTLENAEYYSMPKTQSGKDTISSDVYNSILSSGITSEELERIINGDITAYNKLSDIQKEAVASLYSFGGRGQFKPLYNNTEIRKVDLGISLSISGPQKNISDISSPNFNVPDVSIGDNEYTAPETLGISEIDIVGFDPSIPNITTLNFNPIPVLSLNGTGGGNSGFTGFFPYGDPSSNAIISQMDMLSGTVTVRTDIRTGSNPGDWDYDSPGFYSYTLDNVTGIPSAGLIYEKRQVYDSGGTWIGEEDATLPTGVYLDSINNNPQGSYSQVQGVFKVIDNPITRFGVAGGNVEDFKVILEGDVVNPKFLEQILHYDEHYSGITDPDTGEWKQYTLTEMEGKGWITSAEKTELGNKFLDTTLDHTVDNRWFQYVENNSSWYLKGSSVVAVNIQAHGGWSEANSIFMNRGRITGLNEASTTNNTIGKHVAFMFTEGQSNRKQEGFDNTGKIEFRAPESVIFLFTSGASSYQYYENSDSNGNEYIDPNPGKHILMNNGEMKLYGNSSIGIYSHNGPIESVSESYNRYSDGSWNKSSSVYNSLGRSEIRLYTPITVLGDQSIGIDIEKELNFANSKIKADVGTEDPRQAVTNALGVNGLENSGNMSGGDNRYTDNSSGIYINMTGNVVNLYKNIYDEIDPSNNVNFSGYAFRNSQFTLSDYLLNIGEYSRNGAAVRVEKYGDLILGNSSDSTTNHEINLLAGSEGNAGIYLHGSNDTSVVFEPDPVWNPGYTETAVLDGFLGARVTTDGLKLNINGNKQVGAQIEEYGYFYHNNGLINVNGTNNTGIAVKTGGLGELNNTGVINTSLGNLAVYNDGIFNMNGGNITSSGQSSVGIYSEALNTETNLRGGTLRAENGGIALYAGAGSTINLSEGINLVAGNKGLLFYNYDAGLPSGKYSVTGNVKATVEEGGIAFYLKYGMNLASYLNSSFTGILGGKLGLTMESGSILYLIEGEGSTVSLTTLDGMIAPVTNLANNVNINPDSASDYIPVSMNKGKLILDRDVNLDGNDLYKRAQFALLSVSLDGGKTITGSQDKQTGIAQRNYPGSTGLSDITITNNGIINLSGTRALGIASDYGHIVNNGTVKTTGSNSVAIASSNGSLAENNGELIIGGNETAGIYGLNYLDGITSSLVLGYGNDKIDIRNNSRITSSGNEKVYGIYADNKKAQGDSVITLGAGSDINLQSSVGGIGIYSNNSILTGGGTLTVGTNGLGLYAKDSNINLSGFNLNLHGDNILGFYLDGNTDFTGSGNVNIKGTNIVLFNIQSGGMFNQNFNITSSSGSSYSIGNIKNGTFYYNGISSLSGGGNLLNGEFSAVLLDSGTQVSSMENNVVGVVMDGQYTGTVPSGFTSGIDVENRGNISLKSNSAGLYGTNGARIKNTGNIKAEDNSIGIQSKGTGSFAENTGTITVGSFSAGIYGSDSGNITNTGNILSTGNDSVGIYGDGNTSQTIVNNGKIELSGNNGTGIYFKGSAPVSILNTNILTIGNSTDRNKPGIGIYSQGSSDTVENAGTITSGTSSVGIYINGGTLSQKSLMNVGADGTGIYTSEGTVNLNTGSVLNVTQTAGVGVYALNGTIVINNGSLMLGNNGFGYVLKSGSTLTNITDTSIGEGSIFVYGDGAGNITNNGILTMNGSNGVGFYTVNGGTIQNTGNISGSSGVSNVGIYNENGVIINSGRIDLGDSVIIDKEDSTKNSYSIGIYGDNTVITNTGDMSLGYYGVGIYSKNAPSPVNNSGNISSSSEGVIGLFVENGELQNTGNILLSGNDSIGIYANKGSEVTNSGTITMNGENSTGIYLNLLSKVNNQGTININGNNSQGILLKGGSSILNSGTINVSGGVTGSETISYGGTSYPIPSIINAGIINVSENFEAKGIDILIKVDPTTIKAPSLGEDTGASFVSDAVKFYAPAFNTTEPIGIIPGFASGTHENVYKLKDVFNPFTTDQGGPDSGKVNVRSKSLTWRATPVVNERGNVDIWMEKIPYDNFTSGLWYEDFGKALDSKFTGSKGKAGEIFDKIDTIETELDFRKTIGNLAGDFYSNMNQREQTIARSFESSLKLLKDSENNTKENVKLNIIGGKGKSTEDTDGVLDYDYTTAGVLALREIERTYRHTFGYSLGYLHTNFDVKDGNKSEEKADTLQLGFHNKYSLNDWILSNDVTGMLSFHNVDRVMDWTHLEKSKMSGSYETYSIMSNNKLGKEYTLTKNLSLKPYAGLKAGYTTRGSFTESGLEGLEVKGNDYFTLKPKAGIELNGEVPLGKEDKWKLKGSLDVEYGYELGNVTKREYARLENIETDYHKLSKPEKDKGELRTGAQVGVEIEDRYGIFLTGEYTAGNNKNSDYRAGISLKAVF